MPSLEQLVESDIGLSDAATEHLLDVVADWQVLADLSFADLLMFCRRPGRDGLLVVAHMRPYTAATMYHEDLIGHAYSVEDRPNVLKAMTEGRIIGQSPSGSGPSGEPVRQEAVPISVDGEIVAVVTREANPSMVRAPSQLELTYLETASTLAEMLAAGQFPYPGDDRDQELSPRVGDGMMRLDASGIVTYASPNAISSIRRLGVADNVIGSHLSVFDRDADTLVERLVDGEPVYSEVEAQGVVVLRRLMPLMRLHEVLGGCLLVREVTELRRHERLLQVKDATIREIHHRVKNNLQTVASLLRLQSRRLDSEDAAQALLESVRRISSIALVHETLASDSRERVSFDVVARRLLDMLGTSLTDPDRPVRMTMHGTAGELPPEIATSAALLLSELVQNSVEHAFVDAGGAIVVTLERHEDAIVIRVEDDGIGVPEHWTVEDGAHLGLRIAQTLVETDLGGNLSVQRSGSAGGTRSEARVPLIPR